MVSIMSAGKKSRLEGEQLFSCAPDGEGNKGGERSEPRDSFIREKKKKGKVDGVSHVCRSTRRKEKGKGKKAKEGSRPMSTCSGGKGKGGEGRKERWAKNPSRCW